eukprot:4750658-Alexandrium_andersonii.AAC.1
MAIDSDSISGRVNTGRSLPPFWLSAGLQQQARLLRLSPKPSGSVSNGRKLSLSPWFRAVPMLGLH